MQDKGGQGSHIEWLMRLTLTSLTEKTGDLTLYCELAKIVGPRGTMEGRRAGGDGPGCGGKAAGIGGHD